jgi:cytoskeletal protein CcmA (bactofilin family)
MSSTPNALLGKGSEFEGKLTFEGTVHIDGRFTGEIFSEGTLIIGEGAEVQAEIRVGSIAVYGNVTGNITANDAVELHAPASLRGNILSPALHIDKGVFFDGACQMTNKSNAPARTSAPVPAISRPAVPQVLQSQIPRESQARHGRAQAQLLVVS